MGTDRVAGQRSCATVVGDVVAPDVGEVELGTPLARRHRRRRRAGRRPGRTRQGRVLRRRQPGRHRAGSSTSPVSYEGVRGDRAAAWGRRASSSTTTRPAWSRSPRIVLAVPVRRVVRPVPAVQARARARSPSASSASRAGVGDRARRSRRSGHGWAQVTDGSRCYLATEEAQVVGSILRAVPRGVRGAHRARTVARDAAHLADPEARRPRRRHAPSTTSVMRASARLDVHLTSSSSSPASVLRVVVGGRAVRVVRA